MNQKKNQKLPFYLLISILLLLGFLRFGLYFLKSGGFNGLSVQLIALLLFFLIFALCTSCFFAAWVFQDCKKRGEDPVLWAAIVLIATPFIGLLIYFLRRSEVKRACAVCGRQISLSANYCEECGTSVKNKEDYYTMTKQGTRHLSLIAAGLITMTLMLLCLTGFIVSAVTGTGFNTDVTSNDRVWNRGFIHMNYTSCNQGVWKLDFKSASNGFVKEQVMTIEDADAQMLHAEISCQTVPDNASLILWLVQGENAKSIDVTNLSEPLEYALDKFENGNIHVRLQILGVKNTVSEIYVH